MLARASFSKFPILSQPSTAAYMEMIMKTAEKNRVNSRIMPVITKMISLLLVFVVVFFSPENLAVVFLKGVLISKQIFN